MRFKNFILSLLLLGIVDQINGDNVLIEYEENAVIKHTVVSLSLSACVPKEGELVAFFEGYKIVTCHGEGN